MSMPSIMGDTAVVGALRVDSRSHLDCCSGCIGAAVRLHHFRRSNCVVGTSVSDDRGRSWRSCRSRDLRDSLRSARFLQLVRISSLRRWEFAYLSRMTLERVGRSNHDRSHVTLVFGAGEAGSQITRALQKDPTSDFEAVAFLDDDRTKRRLILNGLRVVGTRRTTSQTWPRPIRQTRS